MTDATDFQTAMADVRRAYRLVWAYQRRVLDTCTAIAAEFHETRHYRWMPNLFDRPPTHAATDLLPLWAWDGLPLYDFTILRVNKDLGRGAERPEVGAWMLEISSGADSEFDETTKLPSGEPDALKFESAENSWSSFHVGIWQCHEDKGFKTWEKAWQATQDWPDEDDSGLTPKPHVDDSSGLTAVRIGMDFADITSTDVARDLSHEVRKMAREMLGLNLPH